MFIFFFFNNIEIYLEKIKNLFNEENVKSDKIIGEKYYEWEIKNWSKLNSVEYSPQFSAGGYKWKIKLCNYNENNKDNNINKNNKEIVENIDKNENNDNNNNEDNISVKLEWVNNSKENYNLEHNFANYIISFRNFNDYECFDAKG